MYGKSEETAVQNTLRTIERRSRLYRKLVQALVFGAVATLLLTLIASATVLLYAPALAVMLVCIWAHLDSAELNRWRRGLAKLGIAPDVVEAALRARSDIPQTTLAEMSKSSSAKQASRYRTTFGSVSLIAALTCGARAVETGSWWWGLGGIGLLISLLLRAQRSR
jgi:uncharacterized membrane protein YoaK (UPF0700 family)